MYTFTNICIIYIYIYISLIKTTLQLLVLCVYRFTCEVWHAVLSFHSKTYSSLIFRALVRAMMAFLLVLHITASCYRGRPGLGFQVVGALHKVIRFGLFEYYVK